MEFIYAADGVAGLETTFPVVAALSESAGRLIVADFLMQQKMRKIHQAESMPSAGPFKAIHGIVGLLLLAVLYFAIFKKPMPSS